MRIGQLVQSSRHRRVHHLHRRKHIGLLSIAIALLLITFVLLLLVSLSLPIIKPIYLLSLKATNTNELVPTDIATELRFGVWGFCATSVLNEPTLLANDGECSSPRLGYDLDDTILTLTGQPQLAQIALNGLIVVLILHPIAAVLCLITLAVALFARVHGIAILALVFTIITALLTTISTVVDLTIVGIAMSEVKGIAEFHFEVQWGNAPWMSLVATVALWLVVVLFSAVLCGCCGVSRNHWVRYDHPDRVTEKQAR